MSAYDMYGRPTCSRIHIVMVWREKDEKHAGRFKPVAAFENQTAADALRTELSRGSRVVSVPILGPEHC